MSRLRWDVIIESGAYPVFISTVKYGAWSILLLKTATANCCF